MGKVDNSSLKNRASILYSLLTDGKELPINFYVKVLVPQNGNREILKVRFMNGFLLQVIEGVRHSYVICPRDVIEWFPIIERDKA